MRKPFNGDYILTQGFGVNPSSYKQFGINGHDGLDYALPMGTPVLAPHAGTVIESSFDPSGYGNYVKIENDVEGSVLAHLSGISVAPGFQVKEGDLIGLSGNSGNVFPLPTADNPNNGAHLHWGYFPKPRDRQNGFDGFIDQLPLLQVAPVVQTIQYTYKYKIGDTIEPETDIPVGDSIHNEVLAYGKVGPHYRAVIIGMDQGYYNIDQSSIGGGSGWVNARTVDTTAPYVAPVVTIPQTSSTPTPVVIPNPVSSTIYTEEQYNALQTERDTALNDAKTVKDQLIEANKKLTAFQALGINNPDDITKFQNTTHETILGITTELQQALVAKQKLEQILQDKDKEDSTAIDEGIKAMQELRKLKGDFTEIAKSVDAKPAINDIILRIFNLKDIANNFFKKIEKEQNDIQAQTTPVQRVTFGIDWLMKFLNLSRGGAK